MTDNQKLHLYSKALMLKEACLISFHKPESEFYQQDAEKALARLVEYLKAEGLI